MKLKLFKILIVFLLSFCYVLFLAYPYFYSKINNYDSLGFFSAVEEKSTDFKLITNNSTKVENNVNHLLKGDKVSAKLQSSENNLGVVLIKFSRFGKVSDRITFRLKEAGKEKWYYEHTYTADQFQPNQYFTFGFTPIANSKNNTYYFELESLEGKFDNGVGLSLNKPNAAFVYKYTRNDLRNYKKLFPFIYKKLIYAAGNVNLLQNWLLLTFFATPFILVILIENKKIITTGIIKILPHLKKSHVKFSKVLGEKIINFLKKMANWFTSTKFYLSLLNTTTEKRLAFGLFIFLYAFIYRYSSSLFNLDKLFYGGIGGQGDYDQFIRAATCALKFCPAILGQNFLIESSVLGIFYEIFGFAGGLKAYLYLMLILSSIVATLPYLLLSRKHFLTIGGIIGSLFLATSDYLTHMALNLPPDNGSLFTFSMFFIVYLLTLHNGTIRWLLFFGLLGTIDGLNKLILLINDLAVFALFVPVFLYEKAKKINKFPFVKLNLKLIFYSIVPVLVFLVIYSAWEYIVQIKFATPYYLGGLIEGKSIYASSTDAGSTSINESLSQGNILEKLYYYAGLFVVMQKRIITYAGLNTMFLAPIFIGLLFFTFRKPKFFIAKLISVIIFSTVVFMTLELFRNNYLGIQDVGQYVNAWPKSNYDNVFLFTGILFLFILNLKYSAIRILIPILPYYIMLIILTKTAPWGRLWVHVIVWSIILLSFLIDWIVSNAKKDYALKKFWIGPILLILFIFFYTIPKTSSMVAQLYSGFNNSRNEVKYLRWVNSELPKEAIILAGGKSDLVTVAQNIKRPIIFSTLWPTALLIKPNEIPRVKPTDFSILDQLKITKMPGVTPSDFSIITELQNKDNFKKNKYLILENDMNIWRIRMAGVYDSVFATASARLLYFDDYSIKAYKFNSALNKGLYELKLKETENL